MTVICWAVGLATGSGFWIATQAMTLSTADTSRIAYFGCGPQKPLVDSATHHLLIVKSTQQQHTPKDTTRSFRGQFTPGTVQLFCRLMCHLYRLCRRWSHQPNGLWTKVVHRVGFNLRSQFKRRHWCTTTHPGPSIKHQLRENLGPQAPNVDFLTALVEGV